MNGLRIVMDAIATRAITARVDRGISRSRLKPQNYRQSYEPTGEWNRPCQESSILAIGIPANCRMLLGRPGDLSSFQINMALSISFVPQNSSRSVPPRVHLVKSEGPAFERALRTLTELVIDRFQWAEEMDKHHRESRCC